MSRGHSCPRMPHVTFSTYGHMRRAFANGAHVRLYVRELPTYLIGHKHELWRSRVAREVLREREREREMSLRSRR